MELSELQKINDQLNLQIEENIRINKNLLHQFLQKKVFNTILWMKIRSTWGLLFLLFFIFMFIKNIDVRYEFRFWMGVTFMSGVYGYLYFRILQNYILIWMLDSSLPVIKLQKRLLRLKKLNAKQEYDWLPVVPIFLAMIFFGWITLTWQVILLVIVPLIIWVAINGFTKNPINKEIKTLDKILDEIDEMENSSRT